MTDEERQKQILQRLAEQLKRSQARVRDLEAEQGYVMVQSDPLPREHQDPSKWVSKEDMERAHAAQSDAEPVAWQWRIGNQAWPELCCRKAHAEYMRDKGAEIRPVFAAPPRPDTSAGLIEAAEITENLAIRIANPERARPFYDLAQKLRALAADRSGK